MSNFFAKENTNVEGKSENEYQMNHKNVKILQIFYSIYENTILIKLLWLISIQILLGINLICSQIVSLNT